MKKALILGVNGQDGSYLSEFLLEKEYQVIGLVPTSIPISFDNIQHILDKITISKVELFDQDSVNASLEEYLPDEVYNLAAPSVTTVAWEMPVQTGDIAGLGVVRLLEAIRRIYPRTHFYQASSSEIFGNPPETPQNETTPFHPRNPYGIAKLYAHWATVNYRQHYDLFAVSGIMYNHESPRRTLDFVTRKISHAAARIKAGLEIELRLGNLDSRRDWGFAGDFVEAMWRMLNLSNPQDFVIGTGETHTVREFLDESFSYLDLDWHEYVRNDPNFNRPDDGGILQSDPRLGRQVLGWQARVTFKELVRMMVNADLKKVGLTPTGEG
jgi:GDPmannose 4,6-dehydratase